ncbi:MAG: ABC transporter permease [Gemmatimonadetes bacterium]|nr:ABC transporter permease [Gemmatimonadota bacterium]
MPGRVLTATRMGFREQRRRTLLLILLVTVPFLFISWSFAITEPVPRLITLPGGETVLTTMRDLHGAVMVPITVGFLAGLVGLFVVQSALESDRRLVVAGFRPIEVVVPRLAVLGAATVIVLGVSLAVTTIDFVPESWAPFVVGNLLVGLIYGAIGALAGVFLGRLGGVYFMFFLPMMDIGVAQNPMFFDGAPQGWATVLPGYGPTRVLLDGAFSSSFHAGQGLAIALVWLAFLSLALAVLLQRSVGAKR